MNKLILIVLFSTAALGAEDFQIPMQRALEFNRWYVKQVNNEHYPIRREMKSISSLRPVP